MNNTLPKKPRGINDMPDEIIREIFSALWPDEFEIKATHISSRSRRVALHMPKLWTSVSSTFSVDRTEAFLSRSQTQPLSIFLEPLGRDQDGNSLLACMTAIGCHSDRWESLDICDEDTFRALRSRFPCLHLPQLKLIDVLGIPLDAIPRTWTMPQLKEVHEDIMSMGIPIPPSVEKCAFVADAQAVPEFLDHIQLLCRSSSMKDLEIAFPLTISESDVWAIRRNLTLPHLTTLRMWSFLGVSWASLIAVLNAPNLQNLRFELEDAWSADLNDLRRIAEVWRLSDITYPNLSSLEICYKRTELKTDGKHDNGDEGAHIELLDALLRKMPKLGSLRLNASCFKPPGYDFIVLETGQNPFSTGPPLRRMEFVGCVPASQAYLRGLLEALRAGPTWAYFRELVVEISILGSGGDGGAQDGADGRGWTFSDADVEALRDVLAGRTLCIR